MRRSIQADDPPADKPVPDMRRDHLQRLNHTLCTPILKFTAISVADVDPSNPWLCFASHRFNR
jgi:hypothetical protein